MKVRWSKLANKQRQGYYNGWVTTINPIGDKMYHYDIFDPDGELQYTGKIKWFWRAKQTVKTLLKGDGEYWD